MSALTEKSIVVTERKFPEIGKELFLAVAAGDKAAFRELYAMTARAVYGYALSILKSREDAEDVMQDTYVRILRCAAGYEDRGKPFAWILTITKNLAFRKLQERQRYSKTDIETLENREDFSHIPDMEQRIVIETALSVLNLEERQIVVLHAAAGLKHREIAGIIGRPLATVLSKYRRALKKLEKELDERKGVI